MESPKRPFSWFRGSFATGFKFRDSNQSRGVVPLHKG